MVSRREVTSMNHSAQTELNQSILNHSIMKAAAALCFLCHGFIALKNSTVYYSEWNTWVQQLFPESIRYAGARWTLATVGTIDIIAAICLFIPSLTRFALLWMVVWGTATATSRLYFLGSFEANFWSGVASPLGEFLVRAPNWIVPLLLALELKEFELPSRIANLSEKLRQRTNSQWLFWGTTAFTFGVLASEASSLASPLFEFERNKIGLPEHFKETLMGLAAAASFALLFSRRKYSLVAAAIAAVLVMVTHEFEEFYYHNRMHGFQFWSIRLAEHATVFYCVIKSFSNCCGLRNQKDS